VLSHLSGKYRLLGSLMYGTGARLLESHQLRVKDLDFDLLQIAIRDGKGAKDRWVMLPDRLRPALRRQVSRVEKLHEADRRRGGGWAQLPGALDRKDPRAGYDLAWQFLFPAARWSPDPATKRQGRYHLHQTSMQRQMKRAVRAAGISKPATCHTLRKSFATEMLRAGYDARSVQKLMGHNDIRTTMDYVQSITDAGLGMRSPLDRPEDDAED
jgi:site-specific recombinase XerD